MHASIKWKKQNLMFKGESTGQHALPKQARPKQSTQNALAAPPPQHQEGMEPTVVQLVLPMLFPVDSND